MGSEGRRVWRRYPELADAEWLCERYVGAGLTGDEIARIVGCAGGDVVLRALARAGIPRRPPGTRPRVAVGQRFGTRVVVARLPSGAGRSRWLVRCDDCGAERGVDGSGVTAGSACSACRSRQAGLGPGGERLLSDRLCECGCGERTLIAQESKKRLGVLKGEPNRYLHGHARRPRLSDEERRRRDARRNAKRAAKRRRLRKARAAKRAMRRQYERPIGPVRVCACGCGEPVPSLTATLIRGHWGRHEGPSYVARECGYGSPCWVWLRGIDSKGYPHVKRGGRRWIAHRLAYLDAFGLIPEGHHVHHDCENKRCVNPAHLRALTPDEHAAIHDGDWQRARQAAA